MLKPTDGRRKPRSTRPTKCPFVRPSLGVFWWVLVDLAYMTLSFVVDTIEMFSETSVPPTTLMFYSLRRSDTNGHVAWDRASGDGRRAFRQKMCDERARLVHVFLVDLDLVRVAPTL